MYVGHFAAGIAIKARMPQTPTWAVLTGVTVLDLLFSPFVLLGIERVTPTPGFAPGVSLDFIDWSHSLAMALFWSMAYALLFYRQGRAVMLTLAFAVFSHFLLDLPMHPGDLALYPHSAGHLGFGLWRSLPQGWWWVELGFIAVASAYYLARAKTLGSFGGHGRWLVAVLLLLHLTNSPWLSPTI